MEFSIYRTLLDGDKKFISVFDANEIFNRFILVAAGLQPGQYTKDGSVYYTERVGPWDDEILVGPAQDGQRECYCLNRLHKKPFTDHFEVRALEFWGGQFFLPFREAKRLCLAGLNKISGLDFDFKLKVIKKVLAAEETSK